MVQWLDYGLDSREIWVRFPVDVRQVSIPYSAHTLITLLSEVISSGLKWPRYESDHSHSSRVEVKNELS
jgi:hypothetical protein